MMSALDVCVAKYYDPSPETKKLAAIQLKQYRRIAKLSSALCTSVIRRDPEKAQAIIANNLRLALKELDELL